MSTARANFLGEIDALARAVSSSPVGSAAGLGAAPGVGVLRRGAVITGLVMLETFVRDRTEEILVELQNWPAQYEDFPKHFRDRATIDALPNIEKFAKMLRRQENDYETEIITQISRMASMSPPAFQFTKFIAGDYTGSLSEKSTEDLLRVFQVKACWASMHALSSDVGFGVPSVKEVLKAIIRNRHRSAHTAGYNPTASDVLDLPQNLTLIGICIDTALSASVQVALSDWRTWVSNSFNWRSRLEIYFIVPSGPNFRLIKKGAQKATRVVDELFNAKAYLPRKSAGNTRLLVEHSRRHLPKAWDIA